MPLSGLTLNPGKQEASYGSGGPIACKDWEYGLLTSLNKATKRIPSAELLQIMRIRGINWSYHQLTSHLSFLRRGILKTFGIAHCLTFIKGEGYLFEELDETIVTGTPDVTAIATIPCSNIREPEYYEALFNGGGRGRCQYLIGYPGDDDAHFCREPPYETGAYCVEHRASVYPGWRDSEEGKAALADLTGKKESERQAKQQPASE